MEYKTLKSGLYMPDVALGTYMMNDEEARESVVKALKLGYEHIDTAAMYNNEKGVGDGIKESGVARERIFLTTKMAGSGSFDEANKKIDRALKLLQTEYVDLFLFHWPSGNISETWRALETAYHDGRVKAIGISNFYGRAFEKIMTTCEIVPMVHQIEAHVFFAQDDVRRQNEQEGIVMEAWSPLACGRNRIFTNNTLCRMARAHSVTISQVALRYLIQKGYAVCVKSVHEQRMKANLDLFDFELTDDEMRDIQRLDTHESLFGWY